MVYGGWPVESGERWSRCWWNGQAQPGAQYVMVGSLPDGRWYVSRGTLGWMTFDQGEDALLIAYRLTAGWQEVAVPDGVDRVRESALAA
jgi:hypothetical protein